MSAELMQYLNKRSAAAYGVRIDVIRNMVFNGKTQLIEGYKQKWPISFY